MISVEGKREETCKIIFFKKLIGLLFLIFCISYLSYFFFLLQFEEETRKDKLSELKRTDLISLKRIKLTLSSHLE